MNQHRHAQNILELQILLLHRLLCFTFIRISMYIVWTSVTFYEKLKLFSDSI